MPIGTVPAAWGGVMTSTWVSVTLKYLAGEVPKSTLLAGERPELMKPKFVPPLVLSAVWVTDETTGAAT